MKRITFIATVAAATTFGLATPALANDAPQFWASDVKLTFVNNTDQTLYDYPSGGGSFTAIAPGASYTPSGETRSPSVSLSSVAASGKGFHVDATVYNPEIGKPYVWSTVSAFGSSSKGEESQSEGERERIVEHHGFEVVAHRHSDSGTTKQYTIHLHKTGAAQLSIDNSASARNTYVRFDGKVAAVRKGEKAVAGTIDRKPTTVVVQSGDRDREFRVTWHNNVATFTSLTGHSATLFEGESATFGNVTVTRADSDRLARTGYTFTVR